MTLSLRCSYCCFLMLILWLQGTSIQGLRIPGWSQALHTAAPKTTSTLFTTYTGQRRFLLHSRLQMTAIQTPIMPVVSPSSLTTKRVYSFVQDDLRPYAMKLHSKDQAPKEGQQKAQVPFTKWTPSRMNYLQFLVDSMAVYEIFEGVCAQEEILCPFRQTGLERVSALQQDIDWMLHYDPTLHRPSVGNNALEYVVFLKNLVHQSVPRFMCHFYNFYFAHTAGGRMIGAKMSQLLLESRVLKFYQWEGDVKIMLDDTKKKIDQLASSWTEAEKVDCMQETPSTFHFGNLIMASLHPPAV